VAHARAFHRRHPHVRLVHGYGPGEATIFTTIHQVTAADLHPAATDLPLGRLVPRTEMLLADDRQRPVPPGQPGEILVAGDGLAAGYLNDPGQTRRRFVDVRRGDGSVGRFYRTGDLAVLDADGTLWFRGRLDRQLKLAGTRIEPGEVEKIIETHPAVCRCIVVATGQGLVAVYTTAEQTPVPADRLRAHAAHYLVASMIPRRFRCVPAIPLNPHGKTDYRAVTAMIGQPAELGPPDSGQAAATQCSERTV
jgi:acyl-CoA synthetase (AMP-forming)/AMP-acid ligase II